MTTTLAAMTDQASRVTVETFLYALQDEDFDTVDSTFADTIVWQKVGWLTLQGRQRIVRPHGPSSCLGGGPNSCGAHALL